MFSSSKWWSIFVFVFQIFFWTRPRDSRAKTTNKKPKKPKKKHFQKPNPPKPHNQTPPKQKPPKATPKTTSKIPTPSSPSSKNYPASFSTSTPTTLSTSFDWLALSPPGEISPRVLVHASLTALTADRTRVAGTDPGTGYQMIPNWGTSSGMGPRVQIRLDLLLD